MKFERISQYTRDIILTGDEKLITLGRIAEQVINDNTYFISKTNIEGLYNYGCQQMKDNWEHAAGYIWSSRASQINKVFGTKLIDIVYYEGPHMPRCAAIDADVLNQLLEETDYVINYDPRVTDSDICYSIQKRS